MIQVQNITDLPLSRTLTTKGTTSTIAAADRHRASLISHGCVGSGIKSRNQMRVENL